MGRSLFTAVRRRAGGRAARSYERLGHRGDPCPQPDHPTFLLDLTPQ
ncbi:hypothetical protein [Micromonospora chalcea]|nr:hypothetical protein [Micromonospora chalcea]